MTLAAEPTTALAITSVGYSKLVNLGNYENEKVTASARIEDGQEPDEVLAELKAWVAERVVDISVASAIESRAWDLRAQVGDLERRLAESAKKWAAAKVVLAAHGVEVPDWEELPF